MSCSAWFGGSEIPQDDAEPILAICVGHSRAVDMGASSFDIETTEWDYNLRVAKAMKERLDELGVPSMIVCEYQGENYFDAMEWLGTFLKAKKVKAAIELHFNSASASAHGSEMLHWHRSSKGKELAECLQEVVVNEFKTRDRGIKPRTKQERGSKFLRVTPCPSVIAEPFFGSNMDDWNQFKLSHDSLGVTLANGFNNYYKHETSRSQPTEGTQV